MPKVVGLSDIDRHLTLRNGYYTYKRRVPASVGSIDPRYPIIRQALGTKDIGEARIKRDAFERADDELWASYCQGGDSRSAEARYQSVVSRAAALGFTYRHMSSILVEESGDQILSRLRALHNVKPTSPEELAILGGVAAPRVTLSRAFEIYVEEIAADELVGKSKEQRELWIRTKRRAVTSFENVCGKCYIDEITRDHARKFYNWWRERIAPSVQSGASPTHSASSGNREIGTLKVLYQRYFEYIGLQDVKNPFEKLRFSDKQKSKRPSFPTEWIATHLLQGTALSGLNDEARAIVLVLIETGARPSEIANLTEQHIRLNEVIPYIQIEPRVDPNDPRQIKTASSIRSIPLVGAALEAMKKFPKGFPRYRDKGNSLSGALTKYFRENGLFPSPKHVIYSLRHSFEDRAKEARLDTELRMFLMGHATDRPKYGEGGIA